jgi:hypothetical protein
MLSKEAQNESLDVALTVQDGINMAATLTSAALRSDNERTVKGMMILGKKIMVGVVAKQPNVKAFALALENMENALAELEEVDAS